MVFHSAIPSTQVTKTEWVTQSNDYLQTFRDFVLSRCNSLSYLIYNSLVLWHWGCPNRETAVTYKAPSISKKNRFPSGQIVVCCFILLPPANHFFPYFTNHSIHYSSVSLRIHLLTCNPLIQLTCFSTENLQLLVKRSSNISVSREAKMLIYSWLTVMENP